MSIIIGYKCYLLNVYLYVGLFRFVSKLLLVLNLLDDLSWSLCKEFVLSSRRNSLYVFEVAFDCFFLTFIFTFIRSL